MFLSYLPAGSYVGEMAVIDGAPRNRRRCARRSSPKSMRLPGDAFVRLLERKPELLSQGSGEDMEKRRRQTNEFHREPARKTSPGVVDMYSQTAQFLVENGIGEATDVPS